MARRLGELLVARGKLSNEQLQKALQAQMIWGGHLGTNLIELGYLTEDELGEILAEAHAVRYAHYQMLQEIPSSVLASIPRGLVEKYKLVPFRFDGKRLHLVMLTPQDLTALDEVSFATGFQLVPYVTPEIRLFQVLEKYYNIPRTKRYITLSRELSLRGLDKARAGGGAPSGGREDRPRPAPGILNAGPAVRTETPAERAAPPDSAPDGTADDEPEYPTTEATDWTPRSTHTAAPAEGRGEDVAGPVSQELVPEPVDGDAAEARRGRSLDGLLKARTLEEVCAALIDEAAETFRRCAVFARSGENFISVAGLAASSRSWAVEGLPLPFPAAAAEALFGERRTYYLGPPPGGVEEGRFYERIGGGVPTNTFLAPVRLSERIALVFYGDNLDEEIRPRDVEGILSIIQQAGLALDLLALRRKDSPG